MILLGAPLAAVAQPGVLVVGDSLSAAHGMADSEGWVALLADRIEAEGFPHRVVNASISGETSRGGRQRLPDLLERHAPAIVIVELGGNDGLRGQSVERLRDNLDAMVGAARTAGAEVLLAGVRLPPSYGAAYTEAFAATFDAVAEVHDGVALVPRILEGVAERREMMQADGIHPERHAQPAILDNVWPRLRPLLEATRR